jgi:ABC-type microcin C transport system permease subunit YejB
MATTFSDPARARDFAVAVVDRLRRSGHETYWAGGCVRDELLGRTPADYDVATAAKPDQVRAIFGRGRTLAVGASFGVITVLGPAIAAITTGGFVVELVFAVPGLGRYFVQAVQQLDYTVIMGTTVFYGTFLVFMVILVDLVYGWIDPRVRLK